jgi:glutathione synthase/RimK-type ligase-like ATP-grasp enzyme
MPNPRVLLATYQKLADLTPSDRILAASLKARGVDAEPALWDAIDPHAQNGAMVCLRSTWDYFKRFDQFRPWIEAFRARPGTLWNPVETVLWNADKIYLRDVEARGVPMPVTHWFEPGVRVDLPRLLADAGWDQAVLKPRVSGGAWGTYRVNAATRLSDDEWAPILASGAIVQEYIAEVATRGEMSLLYFDGKFSHAARKTTAPGDFRVQLEFGGRYERAEVSATLAEAGLRWLAAAGHPWIYARVDLVERDSGPVLMELELIEPELFFAVAPECADTFAEVLIATYGRRSRA